jgi:hypothetical protein
MYDLEHPMLEISFRIHVGRHDSGPQCLTVVARIPSCDSKKAGAGSDSILVCDLTSLSWHQGPPRSSQAFSKTLPALRFEPRFGLGAVRYVAPAIYYSQRCATPSASIILNNSPQVGWPMTFTT